MSGPNRDGDFIRRMAAEQRARERAHLVADNEPPMCFAANARWLNDELFSGYVINGRIVCGDEKSRAHAINAWMILETMRVNRRIARDVKPTPIPPPGDLTNQLRAVTRRLLAKRYGS